jgi:hypothetical protein
MAFRDWHEFIRWIQSSRYGQKHTGDVFALVTRYWSGPPGDTRPPAMIKAARTEIVRDIKEKRYVGSVGRDQLKEAVRSAYTPQKPAETYGSRGTAAAPASGAARSCTATTPRSDSPTPRTDSASPTSSSPAADYTSRRSRRKGTTDASDHHQVPRALER